MPYASRVGVSRKIESREQRAKLRETVTRLLPKDAGGMIVRLKTGDIRRSGRSTQGVRLIDLAEGDRVMGAAILREKDEEAQAEASSDSVQGNGAP